MDVHTLQTTSADDRRRNSATGQRMPGRGLRSYTREVAAADRLTSSFRGLDAGVTKAMALGALKNVAQFASIKATLVHLIDVLFKYSRDVDWHGGRLPIVWPSNELLARELGISVKQVQNLLKQAQALGLLSFMDSPNGKRGGCRNAEGTIIWAYGIVLAPIGTRYDEFKAQIEIGRAQDAALDRLKKRLAVVRRRLRMLTQAAIDNGFGEREAQEALDVALMATSQMRKVRDLALYGACVEQQEACTTKLQAILDDGFNALGRHEDSRDTSCWREPGFTHSTATNEFPIAKAITRSGFAGRRSKRGEGTLPVAEVEEEMAAHGVGLGFITELAYELHPTLPLGEGGASWGEVVSVAERLSHQAGISDHAFREAIRVMGQRGAAASVIVTLQKHRRGEVHRPGAYLRGMSKKATEGTLRLGPTLHGLRDANRSNAMKCLSETAAPPLGALLPGLLRKAGYRR